MPKKAQQTKKKNGIRILIYIILAYQKKMKLKLFIHLLEKEELI